MTNKRQRLAILGAALVLLAAGGALIAGQAKPALDPLLSIERIYVQKDFSEEDFGPARWMKDGASYVLLEDSAAAKDAKDLVLYQAATGRRSILIPAADLIPKGQDKPLSIESYEFSSDEKLLLIFTNSQRVWRRKTRGEFWVFDRTGRSLRRLGGDLEPASLQFAKFSPDSTRVAFVSRNNLYVQDLAGGPVRALTSDGSPTVINGTGDWVYEEEFGLRDGFRWSPDGRKVAFWQINDAAVEDFYLINNTDSLYPKLTDIKYPKAGEPNPTCRIGVADVAGGGVVWIDSGGDPASTYIPWMDWVPGSNEVMLQRMNRLQNTDDVLVARADSGEVRAILTESDPAWVDVNEEIEWTGSGRDFVWLSERDGWRHAYLVSRDGGRVKLLTPGDFDLMGLAGLDEKRGLIYFYASPENPTQTYLFRARLDGKGRPERVSPLDTPGSHSYDISPTGEWAFHTWSRFDTPPRTALIRLPGHARTRMLVENGALREKTEALKRSPTEFFRVDIGGGVELDGWRLTPPDFDPAKSYPLFFYVYGEPAGQTVLDRWGGDTYLWHLMLAQRGYLVVSVDNRGTPAPRGRAWRKCIYRQVGILASADQAAATRALVRQWPYVDPGRIGIWGWSGGGSMTLNALFRYPDLYKVGLAVAFVSNQRYYDSIYQERYMGLPKDNPEGYAQGSPITFAGRLQGKLLLVHGTGDDNVHYQSCEALMNELIRADKRFTVMPYPNRSHGIYEGENTTHHLHEILTGFLMDNLPPGPRK